jgi:hypothetical protein
MHPTNEHASPTMETTYTLKYPLERKRGDGEVVETIYELTFRRLRGADLKVIGDASAKGAGTAMREIVCRACDITPGTYDLLDAEDLAQAGDIAAGFIGRALPTGER